MSELRPKRLECRRLYLKRLPLRNGWCQDRAVRAVPVGTVRVGPKSTGFQSKKLARILQFNPQMKGLVRLAIRGAMWGWLATTALACEKKEAGPLDAGECGDATVLARLEVCDSATDQNSCEAAGGTWASTWLPYCSCPTGQDTCSCTKSSQCRGECIGSMDTSDCSGISVGHCASTNVTMGCYCRYNETGLVESICAN